MFPNNASAMKGRGYHLLCVLVILPVYCLQSLHGFQSGNSLSHASLQVDLYEEESLFQMSQDSDLTDCIIGITNESIASIREVLVVEPALIYITLDFVDLEFDSDTAYLNNTPSIIDPLVWIWVSDEKGFFLRSLPSNFLYLSFGTLKPDVYHTTLEVILTESCDNFMTASDTAKLYALAEYMIDIFVISANNDTFHNFAICQEFLVDIGKTKGTIYSALLSLHVFLYLPSSTEIVCWSSQDAMPISDRDFHFIWHSVVYYLILVIGTLFFPLCIELTVQKEPPLEYSSKKYLNHFSSLPVGLKYSLFAWKDSSTRVFIVRLALFLASIFLLSYLEPLVLNIYDISYEARISAAYRLVVHYEAYLYYTCAVYVCFPLYILVVVLVYKFVKKDSNIMLFLETPEQRQQMFFKELPKEVPEAAENWSWQRSISHYMKYRLQMIVDKQIVWDLFWEQADDELGVIIKIIRKICKVILTFITMLTMFVVYNPFAYMVTRFITVLNLEDEFDDAPMAACICYSIWAIFLFVLCGPLLLVLVRLLVGLAALTANTIFYTLTGLLLNIVEVDPFIFMSLAILCYAVMSVTDFYDDYHQINEIIIQKARRMHDDGDLSKHEYIPEKLFWHVVDQYAPIRIKVAASILKFLLVSIILFIAFEILAEVNLLNQFTDTSVLLYSLMISTAIPIIRQIIKSTADENVHISKLVRKIEDAVEEYNELNNNIRFLFKDLFDIENSCIS